MTKFIKPALIWGAALFITAIFFDSLRFKFAGSPITEHIFTTLRDWSGIGLFYPAGPWVIGLAELGSALFLLVIPLILTLMGLKGTANRVQWLGALGALGVMTGAIGFHLFTPLGTAVPSEVVDGVAVNPTNALFTVACITWVCAAFVFAMRWNDGKGLIPGLSSSPQTVAA